MTQLRIFRTPRNPFLAKLEATANQHDQKEAIYTYTYKAFLQTYGPCKIYEALFDNFQGPPVVK